MTVAAMSVVAVLGAGDLGGALAHTLACGDRFREVRLIDSAARVAEGKALDIRQAGPVERFHTVVTGATDAGSAAGAAVIAVADRFGPPTRELGDDAGLEQLRRALAASPNAAVVCAGAGQASLVQRGVTELRLRRAEIVGSAPLALAASLRALLSLDADVSPQQVNVLALGHPPAHIVVPWESASIGGRRLVESLPPSVLRQCEQRLARLWPPGPRALAAAAAQVIAAFAWGSRRELVGFVALDGELGIRNGVAALPLRFAGRRPEVSLPALTAAERTALENALAGRR
jgi:malate dehydrogenase